MQGDAAPSIRVRRGGAAPHFLRFGVWFKDGCAHEVSYHTKPLDRHDAPGFLTLGNRLPHFGDRFLFRSWDQKYIGPQLLTRHAGYLLDRKQTRYWNHFPVQHSYMRNANFAR